MGLRSWNFQDNGVANANGGVYGPFEFDAFGLMFVGATVPSGAGPSLENVQIRVHPGWKPILLTKDASAFPSLGADGIPMTSGQWFKFGSKNTQWYFSVPNQNIGDVITYWFLAIEDQCFDGNGLKLDPTDLVAGGGGASSAGTATAAAQLIAAGTNNLRGWYLSNFDAAQVYLQIFDAPNAAAVTLGVTIPDLSLGIPAGAAANVLGQARNFLKGIVIAATTTRAGAVAPGVPLDFNLFI
jgi:hypothetical protein